MITSPGSFFLSPRDSSISHGLVSITCSGGPPPPYLLEVNDLMTEPSNLSPVYLRVKAFSVLSLLPSSRMASGRTFPSALDLLSMLWPMMSSSGTFSDLDAFAE